MIYVLFVCFVLICTVTYVIAFTFTFKRRKTHPVLYMLLARAFCVMPIFYAVGMVGAAFYRGHLMGLADGLQTELIGGALLLIFYAALFVCGRKYIVDIIKDADWKSPK